MKRPSLAILAVLLSGCAQKSADLKPSLDSITAEGTLNHIKVLASDEFEGRAPASKGEELTIQYLTDQFKKLGLKPGNPDGTYLQNVPLVGITSHTDTDVRVNGGKVVLTPTTDYIAGSEQTVPAVKLTDSPVVFVVYGVVAPEYGWDDYKDVDVKGKTMLILVNDPPVPDAADATKLDEKMFKGRAMTYYGRWTYKYEIAATKGAAAVLIVHETGPAGYPFEVVSGSFGRENFTDSTSR